MTHSASPRPAPSAQGSFARTPFPHVLQYARERRLTGTLAIACDADADDLAGETLVAFFGGALAQARLPRVLDPLGLLLREQGAIDDAQLNASLRELAARAGTALHGEILRAMGACDDAVLEHALREQLRRKVLRLFAARGATYQYFDGVDLLAGYGRERYPESVLPVIWRGVRSRPDEQAVAQVLAHVAGRALRLRRDSADVAQFGFDRGEGALLDVLRAEPVTPDALARATADVRTARLLVYTLVITKQVELTRSGEVRAVASAAGMPAASAAVAASGASAPAPDAAGPRRMPSFGQMSAVVPPRPPASSPPAPRVSGVMPSPHRPSGQMSARFSDRAPPRLSSRPPPSSPEEAEALSAAESRYRAMQDETYYAMLGVADGAPVERVAAAFLGLAAKWHPDRAPVDTPAVRAAYHAVFALLNEAQQHLCDETLRERYEGTLVGGGGTPNARRRVAAALEAAEDARRAEACLKRRAYEDAEQWARKALHGNPKDPTAQLALAQALIEGGGEAEALAEAEKILRAALAHAPENDRVLYQLGVLLKRKGDAPNALRCFKRAVMANAGNIDAVRELRVAQMRRAHGHDVLAPPAEASEGGGLFARLLKK